MQKIYNLVNFVRRGLITVIGRGISIALGCYRIAKCDWRRNRPLVPQARYGLYRCGELAVDMYQEADAIKADCQIIVEMRDMEDYAGEPNGYL